MICECTAGANCIRPCGTGRLQNAPTPTDPSTASCEGGARDPDGRLHLVPVGCIHGCRPCGSGAGGYVPPTRDPCRRQKPIPPENKFPRQENLRWKTDYLRQENLVAGKYQFLSTPQYPHRRESVTGSDAVCELTRHHIRESSSCSCRRQGQT